MAFKNYYFSYFFIIISLASFSQTPDNLIKDPSNKVKMDFKKIKISKNEKASTSNELQSRTLDGPCIIDPNTGECAEIYNPNPCGDCDGLCDELTGECFEIINPPGGGGSSSSGLAGTTLDEFAVTLSGGASYSVPISLPPGIKDIAPNVAISYNSQSANGLAGWGWNISGLSTITRIPATTYHDGFIDGVNFTNKDRFALDGQRLVLKSGTYGGSGSEYQTENYSNIKIVAYGTSPFGASYGPSYFIAFYPDGTRAWYGNSGSSRGRLEWALFKREDPQGNYIEYNYLQSNNLLRINKIRYGSRTGLTPPNEINFYYEPRARRELSYIQNITFERTNILDRIEVIGGGQLYRKYELTQNTTSLGYQTLTSIVESNSVNESFPAISYTYDSSFDEVHRDGNTLDIYPGIDSNSDGMAVGDFDGDGKMDFITYNRNSRNQLNIFTDIFSDYSGFSIGYSVTTERFDDVFASTILTWNGKVLPQQAITKVRETANSTNATARFRTFALASYGPVFQYDKIVNFPLGPDGQFNCDEPLDNDYRKIPKSYLNGDFNGDGLTDVIAIEEQYYQHQCYEQDFGQYWDCVCDVSPFGAFSNSKVYFVDLKRTANTTALHIGNLPIIKKSTDRLYAVDFDGDGKTDLMHIKNGLVKVYSLNSSNQLVEIATHSNSFIDINKPILIGDYNGDGKTDFAQPSGNNNSTWYFYLSKGNSIHFYSKNIGITYTKNYVHNGGRTVNGIYMNNPMYEFHYISQDFNGDGKSDIIKHEVVSPYSSSIIVSDRLMLYANQHLNNESTPSFSLTTNSLATNNGISKFGIPLFLEAKGTNNNLEYAYIDGNNVHTYEFFKDHKKDTELKKITNNGVVTDIFYERLNSVNGTNTYSFNFDQDFPFVNINVAPSFQVVKEAKHTGSGQTQTQQFKYVGAVAHTEGFGFLGFKEVMKTNWFGDGVETLWNVSKHDMQKRGTVSQQWVSLYPTSIPYSFVNKTTYTYSTQTLANKVFINVPTQILSEDGLQGISSTESYTYDAYKNPLTINTTFPDGSKVVNFEYINNPSATNQFYHIGRPTKRIETNTLSGNTFSTEVQFTYNNNLVTQTKRKGNGTPWLTETFQYDVFGNTTQKTISGTGVANRVESFVYDASGRFMTKSTDILGLETTFAYNTATGNPISTTSLYGQTTNFEYDAWQRLLKETNYLGKETHYAYNKENVSGLGWCLTNSVDYPDGQDVKTYYNAFGWVVRSKQLSLNNQWIQKSFEYDAVGRQTRESEPYFSTSSPTQWNQVDYDEYGRPISHSLFTGKVITTSYNGLTVTVDDGTKTVTTTKDAVGNIATLQDPGGTITYQYYGNGTMKSANYGSHVVSTTIDGWGRKASLTDPSAGTYTYQYNILGEITQETTPKGTTNYSYDSFGRITAKTISGDQTDLSLNYQYDGTTKLLTLINGLNNRNGDYSNYTYNYYYDSYKRLDKIKETTQTANFEKRFTFDAFGRVESENYITNHLGSGTNSNIKVKSIYDAAGIPIEIRDFNTNNLLWKINDENARGQALNITLGNGLVKNKQYDQYGFLTNITDKVNATGGVQALKMDYDFDVQRGILNSRKNYGFTNWDESFTHDNLDRLTQVNGPVPHTKDYDGRGRITNNSWVGDYNYVSGNAYRLANIDLNNQGDIYYQQHSLQQISYNAFKKPVEIYEENKGRVSFEYGPVMNRTHAFYGGLNENKTQRQYHKQYSSIMPVEVVFDNASSSAKIVTYIAGDAYTAPIVHIKSTGGGSGIINAYHYLHRDYLGSILAITNASGALLEQRHFGAWGTTDKFVDSQGNTTFGYSSLINRGFTGHEHFFDVSLIHMNGRMYDAQLGRFLSPDNFIQDPFNTQSFNRYGYVWNNPLVLNDPSGELIPVLGAILAGALIGAATAAAVYSITALITGNWSLNDFGKSILYGAIGGAISGGLSIAGSSLFSSAIANGGTGAFWQSATFNVLREVASQVGTSLVFGDGITLGTIVGSVAGGIVGGKMSAWSGVKGGYLKNAFSELGYETMKGGARGAVAGGIGSLIDGKNIRDGILNGAKNGAIGGAAQSAAMIATFGATYKPTNEQLVHARKMASHFELSTDNVAWRKGGLYQLFFNREVVWGNNVVTLNDTSAKIFGHEYGHIIQYHLQGWAQFQGKGLIEQTQYSFYLMGLSKNNPYNTPNTNESGADEYLKLYGN